MAVSKEYEAAQERIKKNGGVMVGYDVDGKPMYAKCEICGATSSALGWFKNGERCGGCYSKYGDTWTPEEVDS